MELTKAEVRALSEHRCFGCKWSQIDPFDWGLRCCNGDSEHCTDYCPEDGCEQYYGERTCGDLSSSPMPSALVAYSWADVDALVKANDKLQGFLMKGLE